MKLRLLKISTMGPFHDSTNANVPLQDNKKRSAFCRASLLVVDKCHTIM